jgi:YesN/AraC family two-component response regulator
MANVRILIVEDHESLRKYLNSILSPSFVTHQVSNGREALDYLEKLKSEELPTLILSDIMMPEMDGFQLAEHLKANDRYRPIPLVILTARADMKDKLKALRIGVDDYLLKPFEEDELLARILNLVKNVIGRNEIEAEAENKESGEKALKEEIFFTAEDQQWLQSLEEVVMSRMANFNLDAEMLANQLAMSRTTFFRRVKQLTGLTAQQYVSEVRYRVAREWLETRRYSSVKTVAHSVGLRDVEHFSRQFRERFGKLPSSYLN